MDIKASSWNRFMRIGSIPAIPVVLFLMFRPDWGLPATVLTVVSYAYLGFIGGTGALVTVLMRFGVIVFVYSPRDKQTMVYRMSQDCAAMEKSIWGNAFSKKYYDTYLKEKHDNQDCRTTDSTIPSEGVASDGTVNPIVRPISGDRMRSDNKKTRKEEAMTRVRAVQAILRRWDPIGVRPGEVAPADEYDSFAPHIVSMVAQGCTVDQLSNHLEKLRTGTIGVEVNPERDADIASEIIAAIRSETA